MRLIDADELIKRIKKWIPQDPCGQEQTLEEVVATDVSVSVLQEIEEMPTAFNKEKVKMKISENRDIDNLIDVEHAIHIVEKGEIE